ncbi:DNA sulfur modification protein DndB [Acinetobacter colistiniresistens]|uniref:DNA sulfur modification protein DndB n=1 Tax=Acinetobacter colistiniresistens TaxID=280145 RepID=UPI001250B952|nr:DNA sulfur modification protein DndB [Acinetobacter colistiniresistens]
MSNIFPSLRAIMGNWVYYPILMSASEISDRVMRSKDIRENKTLDDYLQREITPNVKKILSYIKNNEDRFFNSIIVGVFDDTPNWYPLDLKHVDILSDERREYIEDSMGLLELKGSEKLFAIDGQHRIEAIKREVLDNPDYKDQFSIILVQHVDSISGKKRTRKLFSDINKKAVKVSDGELAIIDEEELENIVARKIYSEYERIPHTSIELSKVTEVKNPKYFTSLLTIVSIARKLKTKLKVKTEDNLYKEVKSFFDLVLNSYPEIVKSFSSEDLTADLRDNRKMIFMRHVGLEVLAEIYCLFTIEKQLEVMKEKITSLDLSFTSDLFKDNIYKGGGIRAGNKAGAVLKLKNALNNK